MKIVIFLVSFLLSAAVNIFHVLTSSCRLAIPPNLISHVLTFGSVTINFKKGHPASFPRRGEAGSIAHLEFSLEGADFEAKIGFSREAAIYKLKSFLMAMKSKQLDITDSVIILDLVTSDIVTLFLWIS
ncbi:hypothetical protein L2E82_46054 [Cichorium intybus]|uniref:Uncharacterized protein n=1 Tax=Cichorium intybus TaxID=13427 RepID=A0ACB8YSK9_CICIN|nr:hypothetical protein L2E82_46054 [Cichorium intybus]